MWPNSALGFRLSYIFWSSCCNRFPCNFSFRTIPGFRFKTCPWFLTFLSRQVFSVTLTINLLRCASFRHPWELDAASGFEFPKDALSISKLFDAIGLFTDEALVETVTARFTAVGFDFATILSSCFCSCILFAIVLVELVKLKFWAQQNGAGMADVKQMKKLVPFVTCEVPFGQYVCELMFGVDVPIEQPIKSNSVGSWHMSHCGTSAFDYHINHGFIILKDMKHSTKSRIFHVRRNVINIAQIKIVVLGWNFVLIVLAGFPVDWSLDLLDWFGEEWNTLTTKSQRSRAEIPSMRKPALREHFSFRWAVWDWCLCLAHPTFWHERMTYGNA